MIKLLKHLLKSGLTLEIWYNVNESRDHRWNVAGWNGLDQVNGWGSTLEKAVKDLAKNAEVFEILRIKVDSAPEV